MWHDCDMRFNKVLLWCGFLPWAVGWQVPHAACRRAHSWRQMEARDRSRGGVVLMFNPLDALNDELVRESGNLVQNVGKIGFEGLKLTGEVVKVAAPVVGQGVKTAVDTMAPIVKDGVDTATPIVGKALKDGYDTAQPLVEKAVRDATPIVERAVRDGIDYTAPAATAAANKALAAIQPYIDAGQAVPESLLRQAQDAAGPERVAAALEANRATRTGVASALRGVAKLLDGSEPATLTPPPPPPPPPTPAAAASKQLKVAIEAKQGLEKGLQAAVEAKRQQALAPLYKFEADLERKVEEFVVVSGLGLVTLGFVRRFFQPLERFVRTTLLVSIVTALIYGAATYGPKAVKIYRILNDDAASLSEIAAAAPY